MAEKQINVALATVDFSHASSWAAVPLKGQRIGIQELDPDAPQHLREYEGDGISPLAELVALGRYRPSIAEVNAAIAALDSVPGGDTITVIGAGQSLANGLYVRNDAATVTSFTPVPGSPIYQNGNVLILLANGSPDNWFIYNEDTLTGYYVGSDHPADPRDVTSWASLESGYDPAPTVTGGTSTIAAALAAKASISYVDTSIANAKVGLWNDRGNHDASGNDWPASGGSGTAGAILKGDVWTVSVAGTLGGAAVDIGDTVRAKVDAPGTTAGNWAIAETNVQQATESARGTLKVARSVDMESPTTTNDVDAVTPKKWYEGFTAALGTTGFRNAVRGVLLDGLSVASAAAVTAADSILVAIGKLQAQVTALRTIGTSGMIEVAKNKSYVLIYKTAFPGTVLNMQVVCDTGGTVTAAVKINGTAITGISAVSVSSTPATATATAANTYAAGATVELTLSANASAKNVRWTLAMLRTL